MADSGDQPSKQLDVDPDKSELKVVGSKQRLAKQAEVEVLEETESPRTVAGKMADNGEDQSPNSDESDRTVVYTGQLSCRLTACSGCQCSQAIKYRFNGTVH